MHGPIHLQLAQARKVARINQTQIASAIGWTTHAQVSHVESGSKETTIRNAEVWARACGFEFVLVPIGDVPDAEGLADLVASVRDPAARQVLALLARLVRSPHRYWMHLLDDIRHELARAIRDEGRGREG